MVANVFPVVPLVYTIVTGAAPAVAGISKTDIVLQSLAGIGFNTDA